MFKCHLFFYLPIPCLFCMSVLSASLSGLPACLPCFLVNNLQTFFPVHFRARNNNIIVENYGDSVQDREIPNPITVFEEAFEHYGKCLPSYTCWVIFNCKDECHTAYHTHNRDCNKLRITFLSCRWDYVWNLESRLYKPNTNSGMLKGPSQPLPCLCLGPPKNICVFPITAISKLG